jgi:hypothetical protein
MPLGMSRHVCFALALALLHERVVAHTVDWLHWLRVFLLSLLWLHDE